MSIKAVIFDLDGTLLDTIADLADASNATLRKYNFPEHDERAYNYFVGDGLRTLMERAVPAGTSVEMVDACCATFNEIYDGLWHNKTQPYNGIQDMLNVLSKHGVCPAILSNKPHLFTKACVGHFFPEGLFALVFGQRDEVAKKPDPAGALEIAEKLGVQRDECVYVGDTSVDMRTGKGAGMFTIGVSWGFRPVEELREHGADLIVSKPAEIVDYVVSAG